MIGHFHGDEKWKRTAEFQTEQDLEAFGDLATSQGGPRQILGSWPNSQWDFALIVPKAENSDPLVPVAFMSHLVCVESLE